MIAIVDYGAGNIYSVLNRLRSMEIEARLTCSKGDLHAADGIILPGVGAFGYAARALEQMGLAEAIKSEARGGKPLFGICLGMQLLFESSEESAGVSGLGLIGGAVTRIKADKKIPHIGWTSLDNIRGKLLSKTSGDEYFYFVHSYGAHADESGDVAATSEYGERFDSVVERGNVMGTQFHPEKSGAAGLKIFERFIEICGK